MRQIYIPAIVSLAVLCSSCDEGRIEPTAQTATQAGRTVRMEATISGIESWPSGYTVSLAAFRPGDEYAEVAKTIPEGGDVVMELSGVPSGISTVEICAIDRLRRRVATFASMQPDEGEGSMSFTPGEVAAGMYDAMQTAIFDTRCVQCHGRTGHAAAGLDLTFGQSYASLVGVPSVKEAGNMRVDPGNPEASTLYRALAMPVTSTWGYDHSVEVVDQPLLQLVSSWIEAGASE